MHTAKLTLFIAVLVLLFAACETVPEQSDIPEDLTTQEYFQRAQEAVDQRYYETALVYYRTYLERNPDDVENRVAAQYEIAFLHYKMEDYDTAQRMFEELLEHALRGVVVFHFVVEECDFVLSGDTVFDVVRVALEIRAVVHERCFVVALIDRFLRTLEVLLSGKVFRNIGLLGHGFTCGEKQYQHRNKQGEFSCMHVGYSYT